MTDELDRHAASSASATTASSTTSGATARSFVVDLTLGLDTRPAAAERRLAGHGRLREPRGHE